MTNIEYVTYGGFDQIVQSLTMMQLIFHDSRYTGLIKGIAILGMVLPGVFYFIKNSTSANSSNISSFTSWFLPSVIGIVLWSSFINKEANLQVTDFTLGRTQAMTVPLGVAMTMGLLNKFENEMVDVISNAGDVNSPNDYRRFSGGSGFDTLTKQVKHQNAAIELSMQSYMDDCFGPVVGITGYDLDINDYRYGTASGVGFFTLLSKGAVVLLDSTDFTQTPAKNVSCNTLWMGVLFPHYSNPVNFMPDLANMCSQSDYDPNDPQSIALCTEKIEAILLKETNKSMGAGTYVAQNQAAQIAMSNLNGSDPSKVTEQYAGKTLQSQGLGIGIVITKYAPKIKTMMVCIIAGMLPLLCLLIPTPLFGKVLKLTFGLFVWLTVWTITDCSLHTAMQYYISNQFSALKDMGNGILYYMSMPDAASEAVSMFGYAKGLSITVATVITTGLGIEGGHAMASLVGGMQSHFQQAGQQAGAVGFTPEGRAQAIDSQHRVGESMTNAFAFKPSDMTEKGRINAQHSMGQAQSIKRGHQEAIDKGLMPAGSSIAAFTSEMGFKGQQNQIGGFKSQADGMKAAQAQGLFPKNGNLTDWHQSSQNTQQHFVGSDGKSYSAAVDKAGNMVWSDAKTGHSESLSSNDQNNRTVHADKTNLGAVNTSHKNGIQNSKTDIIRDAEKTSKTAAETVGTSRTASKTTEDAFSKTLNNSKALSKADKQVVTNGFSRTYTASDSDTDKVSKSAQVTKDQASSFMNKVQAQARANASLGLKVPLTNIGADVAAEMSRSGEISNATSIKKLETVLEGKDYNHVVTDAEAHSRNINQIREKGVSTGDTKLVAGVDSMKAAYATQASASTNFTASIGKEKDLSQAMQTMQNSGIENSFDDSARVLKELKNTHGEEGANKILNDINNPSSEKDSYDAEVKLQRASNKVTKQYSAAVYAEADKIKSEREAGSQTISKQVDTAEANRPDVENTFKTNKAEIDTARKGEHVEAGHKIGSVNTALTPENRQEVRQSLGNRIIPPTEAVKDEINQLNKQLQNIQSGLMVPSALASMADPRTGMFVAEKSGKVVNAVEDFGIAAAKAVPGLAKDFAKEAVPIAFPEKHQEMSDKIKSTVGGRLGAKD